MRVICSVHDEIEGEAKSLLGLLGEIEDKDLAESLRWDLLTIIDLAREAKVMGQKMEDGLSNKRGIIEDLEKELSQAERDRDAWEQEAEWGKRENKSLMDYIATLEAAA